MASSALPTCSARTSNRCGARTARSPPASDATAIAPTVEITRIDGPRNRSEDPTQEVPIEELGLDIGDTVETGGGEGMFAARRRRAAVEDTVESPQLSRTALGEDEDLLSASGILKEQTGILPMLDSTNEVPKIEYEDATGELPTIETARIEARSQEVDFPLGDEPFTMSEVGTKLDLARAYLDMGDPEGARSILDEVLKEGNAEQKQEAERLMASMP